MKNIISEETAEKIVGAAEAARERVRLFWEMVGLHDDTPEVRSVLVAAARQTEKNARRLKSAAAKLETSAKAPQPEPNLDAVAVDAIRLKKVWTEAAALIADAASYPTQVDVYYGDGDLPVKLGGENKDVLLAGFPDLGTALEAMFANAPLVKPGDMK